MELLFGISYTNKDDVIYMLVNPKTGIPENDFNVSALDEEGNPTGQVEIIGWMYQYYNTELKDDTFDKTERKCHESHQQRRELYHGRCSRCRYSAVRALAEDPEITVPILGHSCFNGAFTSSPYQA